MELKNLNVFQVMLIKEALRNEIDRYINRFDLICEYGSSRDHDLELQSLNEKITHTIKLYNFINDELYGDKNE